MTRENLEVTIGANDPPKSLANQLTASVTMGVPIRSSSPDMNAWPRRFSQTPTAHLPVLNLGYLDPVACG